MINPEFIDEENVPLIADDDYEETSFTFPPPSSREPLGDQPSFGTPHYSRIGCAATRNKTPKNIEPVQTSWCSWRSKFS